METLKKDGFGKVVYWSHMMPFLLYQGLTMTLTNSIEGTTFGEQECRVSKRVKLTSCFLNAPLTHSHRLPDNLSQAF
jgi:hypothetical protein